MRRKNKNTRPFISPKNKLQNKAKNALSRSDLSTVAAFDEHPQPPSRHEKRSMTRRLNSQSLLLHEKTHQHAHPQTPKVVFLRSARCPTPDRWATFRRAPLRRPYCASRGLPKPEPERLPSGGLHCRGLADVPANLTLFSCIPRTGD